MKETAETLQILVLFMTVLLQVIMAVGLVYILRLLFVAIKDLPKSIQSIQAHAEAPVPTVVPFPAPTVVLPPALPRYKCARCDARLPEHPVTSRIDGELTLFIYKCGRCGKHTEVAPSTGEKKEVETPALPS